MHLNSNHKTAILVFARSSKEETANKSINNGAQLFDTLTNQVLETASKTQIPCYHYSEEQQKGNTFGERFTNAIQKVFEKGYEQIIAIGNDTPQLTVSHILEAERRLQAKNFILGPSVDGGFYLMGIHKSQFNECVLKQLAWQTSGLSKQLLNLIKQKDIEVFQLQTLYDIDTEEDVKSIISYTYKFAEKLLRALLATLSSKEHKYSNFSQNFGSLIFDIPLNKGSPVLLSL